MSRPPVVAPTMTREDSHGQTFTHPAFATVGATRVSATPGAVLFGSDFRHGHYMTITVREADLVRGLSQDWIHGGREIVSVALSEAQWATFVSSPNMGGGVPCTLEHVNGECRPELPFRAETTETQREAKAAMTKAAQRVRAAIADIEGELGAALSKPKRAAVLQHLHALDADLTGRLPFIAQQLAEQMEQTVEKAKIEVNAYVQAAVQRAGLAAINAGAATPVVPLSLDAGPEVPA